MLSNMTEMLLDMNYWSCFTSANPVFLSKFGESINKSQDSKLVKWGDVFLMEYLKSIDLFLNVESWMI